jgi:hypothetical protein
MHNTPNQYQMQHINGMRGFSVDMKGVCVSRVPVHVHAGPPANNGVAGYLNNRRHTSGNRGNSVVAQQMPPWQQSPVHASSSMSPPMLANSADSTHDLLSEWQQETRNELQSLLPNVSVRVATGPQAHYAPPRTSMPPPPPTGWPPQQSRGLPFNQPPPMLHMGGMHHGSPMRPSPPMAAPDFAHPPPHLLDRAGLPPHLGE